jgi:hypothetical protein
MVFPVPKKPNKVIIIPTLGTTILYNFLLHAAFYFFQVDYKWNKKKNNRRRLHDIVFIYII